MQVSAQTLNAMAALASLFLICFKRCDFFSLWNPIYILIPCTQQLLVLVEFCMNHNDEWDESDKKELYYQIVVSDYYTTFVFAGQHLCFVMQYLRAGLTVPLYFERREKVESNRMDRVIEIDRRCKRINRVIIAC